MARSIIWTVIFSIAATILQSTLIAKIAVFGVIPDIALCVLVFSAYVNGTMTGQVSGFFSGLFYDFITPAPIGLNCMVRTVIGAAAGIFKGQFFLDILILPVILCVLATIFKALIIFIIHLIMGPTVPSFSLITPVFWIEAGLNALSAPLLFLLLKHFKPILIGRQQ